MEIDFRRHVAIFGTTGSGKSTTLRTLLAAAPAVLFDMKGELGAVPGVHGLRVAAYDLDLCDFLNASAAGGNLLHEVMTTRGVVPTIARLTAELDNVYASDAVRDALLRSIRARGACDWICEPSTSVEELLSGRHIVPASAGYAAQVKWLLATLLRLPECETLRLVLAFEEAHLLRRLDLATGAKMLRSKGVGCVFLSQHPRDLDPAVLGCCNTRIVHRLLAGTPGERAYLREFPGADTLATGEAIVNGERVRIVPKDWADFPTFTRSEYVR